STFAVRAEPGAHPHYRPRTRCNSREIAEESQHRSHHRRRQAPAPMNRRTLLQMAPAVLTGCATARRVSKPTGTVIDLWPGYAPGGEHVTGVQAEVERSHDPNFHDVAIVHTTKPTLTFFRPQKPNGASVLIVPGGSYQRVVVGKEGYEIANWLTS